MGIGVYARVHGEHLEFGVGDLELAVRSSVSVLITGETAAKRESCARLVHDYGLRQNGPFVALSFSPDVREPGRVDGLADGLTLGHVLAGAREGTVFLDEIGGMNVRTQRLLSAMMESAEAGPRIIAGSSRSLWGAVASGSFLESLFYRLNVIHLRYRPGPGSTAIR